jgi:hypothetical protein
MSDSEHRAIADRFILTQTWWIASELVRRHPHLLISRIADDTVGSPILIVHDEQKAMRIQFDLLAWIQYLATGELRQLDWQDVFSHGDAHAIVKRIEAETGLGKPVHTPSTNGRSLAYRMISRVLASTVDDRHTWQAVPALLTQGLALPPEWEQFGHLPTAFDAGRGRLLDVFEAEVVGNRQVLHQQFWALTRDLETVALLDIAGFVHTASGKEDLMEYYRMYDGNLTMTVAEVLGEYLP